MENSEIKQEKRPAAEDFFDDEVSNHGSSQDKPAKKSKVSKKKSIRRKETFRTPQLERTVYYKGEALTILKWIFDISGDEQNIRYFIPDSSKIPRFKRCRFPIILGENDLKVSKSLRNDLDLLIGIKSNFESEKIKRYFMTKYKNVIRIAKNSEIWDCKEFIPIEGNQLKIENEETRNYELTKMYNENLSQNPKNLNL